MGIPYKQATNGSYRLNIRGMDKCADYKKSKTETGCPAKNE